MSSYLQGFRAQVLGSWAGLYALANGSLNGASASFLGGFRADPCKNYMAVSINWESVFAGVLRMRAL